MLILSTPQNKQPTILRNFFGAFQFSGALILASLLIFIIAGGLSVINLGLFTPTLLTGLDTENLNEELRDLDLKIKLTEVKYYEDSLNKVSVALIKTSEKATDNLGSTDPETEDETIEDLLNELAI